MSEMPASGAASGSGTFTLMSPAFVDGREIPQRYGCSGADVSPPLQWTNAPAGTTQLVLVVDDPDARGFLHWLLIGILGAPDGTLEEGRGDASKHPDGQGGNDFGRTGWGGPCPPRRHTYAFTLYALSRPIDPGPQASVADVRAAMEGLILGEARLTGTYEQRG